MLFELTDEEKMIQETAAKFAKRELEPVAAKLDKTKDRSILLGNLKKLAELGFMGLNVSPEYGGRRDQHRGLQPGHDGARPGLRLYHGHRLGEQHGVRGDPGGGDGRAKTEVYPQDL